MSVALKVAAIEPEAEAEGFRGEYEQALRLIERLHRLLLDVIKSEFDRVGGADLNSVQALLLYNIGDSELTAGELKSRGYYLQRLIQSQEAGRHGLYPLPALRDRPPLCARQPDREGQDSLRGRASSL